MALSQQELWAMVKNKKKTKEKKQETSKEASQEQPQETPVVDYKDILLRTQANFENYRKQSEKRIEDIRKMASRTVILEILPIVDNFELALKNVSEKDEFSEGVELIYSQLATLLKDKGVEAIETSDKNFDPHLHEALMKVSSDEPENKILEEFQKGYTLNGSIIRHARVKISAGKEKK